MTACIAAGATTVVITDDQPAPQLHTIAEPSQPAVTRHFDTEADEIASGAHVEPMAARAAPPPWQGL